MNVKNNYFRLNKNTKELFKSVSFVHNKFFLHLTNAMFYVQKLYIPYLWGKQIDFLFLSDEARSCSLAINLTAEERKFISLMSANGGNFKRH